MGVWGRSRGKRAGPERQRERVSTGKETEPRRGRIKERLREFSGGEQHARYVEFRNIRAE